MSISRTIKEKGLELGYADVGIGTAEPFGIYTEQLTRRHSMYAWSQSISQIASVRDFSLFRTAEPSQILPEARSIIVGVNNYFDRAFPSTMEGTIGRCYQAGIFCYENSAFQERSKKFRTFLDEHGFKVKFAQAPARLSGARAGVVSYGNNCFAYANRGVGKSSWITMDTYIVDEELEYDAPATEVKCPKDCRRCLDACPTGALYAPLEMDPRKCIAYQSYFTTEGIPRDMREKMGTWIYGCDVCQDVCPRNQAWLKKELPVNQPLFDRANDFDLTNILTMSEQHYHEKIWPLLYYIRKENRKIWQRNAAVAIGNRGDSGDVSVLAEAMNEPEALVRGHVAWALGQIGGSKARQILEHSRKNEPSKEVLLEIDATLERG